MGRICCVKSCKQFWTPVTSVSFFAFPFNNEEMKEKWIKAAPGYKTLSKYSTVCSNHFLPQDYTTFTGKRILNKNAVPSIFGDIDPNVNDNDDQECSSSDDEMDLVSPMIMLYKPNSVYNTAVQISARNFRDLQREEKMAKKVSDVSVQTCPRLSGPSEREKELQHKIHILQGRLRSRDKLIKNMKGRIEQSKKESKCSSSLEAEFLKKFTTFDLELFKNVANNNDVPKNTKTYTHEMKTFATTLYSYSPRAYKFVRTKINLPHAATIRRWIAESAGVTKINEILEEEVVSNEIEEEKIVMSDSFSDPECGPDSPVSEDIEMIEEALESDHSSVESAVTTNKTDA